jgi:hypothetical protein
MSGPADLPDEAIEDVARLLDEQDMAGGGSRWNDVDPPGWQSQDALRAAYRHRAAELLAAALPPIRAHIADQIEAEASNSVPDPVGNTDKTILSAFRLAARVARGGDQHD